MNFSSKNIRLAESGDTTRITQLLNEAYRGETAKQGWTHEADLIGGLVRTNEEEIESLTAQPASDFLVYEEDRKIIGCVNLQSGADGVYLGMLSVDPGLQTHGIGKALLFAADEYAVAKGKSRIYMSVISDRTELIDYYCRRGYADTGERKFFAEDSRSGNHLKPLYFSFLEKRIAP